MKINTISELELIKKACLAYIWFMGKKKKIETGNARNEFDQIEKLIAKLNVAITIENSK